tara:strand:- start:3175 stop:3684 length:510 start_codon:yes stop_codon:yes gene_type:complete
MPKVTVKEGLEIAEELFAELANPVTVGMIGVGLAANQIGIEAAVAVVDVIKPRILINPFIVDKWDKIPFPSEGCLSYPGKRVDTVRYKCVIIKTEQEEANWYFSGVDGMGGSNITDGLLEAVAVQHEIDHLNGKTILDRRKKPIKIDLLPGRNDPCKCGSQKKYKKCCL